MVVDSEHIENLIGAALSQWQQPGLAISVVNSQRILYQAGFGVTHQGVQSEVDEHTIFGIASCTKPFVAASVALLVDEKLVSFDDKIIDHLPGFQLYDSLVTESVTIRDLLCMRVGISSGEGRHRPLCVDRADYISRLRHHSPIHEFRGQFSYWTDGFTVLAELVSRVVGKPWEQFLQERIWGPLGMSRTNANRLSAMQDVNCAAPHDVVSGAMQPISWLYEDHIALGAGGVNASVSDLSKWLQFVLRGGTVGNKSLISVETMQELMTPHTDIYGEFAEAEFSSVIGDGSLGVESQAYALGWYVHNYRGYTVKYHTGKIDGFQSVMGVLPDEGVGLCVLINSSNYRMQIGVFQAVLDSLLGIDESDWSQAFLAQKQQRDSNQEAIEQVLSKARGDDKSPHLPLPKFEGEYVDKGCYGQLDIRMDEERLIGRSGTAEFLLTHWRNEEFEVFTQPPQVVRRLGFACFQLEENSAVNVLHWWDGAEFKRNISEGVDDMKVIAGD